MPNSLGIAILGSTGSIGTQTLDVVRRNPKRFHITALSAQRNCELLASQCHEFRPAQVAVGDPAAATVMSKMLPAGFQIHSGEGALETLVEAANTDIVVAAVVGFAGLRAVHAAIGAGKAIALANKESLVAGGPVLSPLLRTRRGALFPIDSEHNSIFQLLRGYAPHEISRVVLTASGGPFLRREADELRHVTPHEAVSHPRWKMGAKISVDSATLMNKGLELIEARWLFDMEPARLDAVIHPQSLVHGLIELRNGTILAAMSQNDMRLPIAVALEAAEAHVCGHEGRATIDSMVEHGVPLLDLASAERLEFYKPDENRFPALSLCRRVMVLGEGSPAVLNGANEIAVQAFLDGRCQFTDIVPIVAETVGGYAGGRINSLSDVISADEWSRARARQILGEVQSK